MEYPVTKVVVKGTGTLPPIFKRDLDIFRKILEDMKKDCDRHNEPFEFEFN